jgi:hypothetical protein
MATDAEIAGVRRWVGSTNPDDDAIWDAFAEFGTVELTAKAILEQRLADLLDGPASFSVHGYSESNAQIITSLEKKILELSVITGTEVEASGGGPIHLERLDRRGR